MTESAVPFLKWPGGKRWLVPHLRELLATRPFQRYVEPFLGGGAVFFGLRPPNATLSDVNEDLINTYQQVQSSADALISRLQTLPVDKQTYLALRSAAPTCSLDRAVRFLYLNRTAFAGMYRLNRQGQFNVPFGGGQRTPEPLWNNDLLVKAAAALGDVTTRTCDFEDMIDTTAEGDLVYCDPTYTVAHNNNGFIRYNEKNFSWKDQDRLARASRRAASRGACVLVSNAVHPDVLQLYPGATALELNRKSLVCPISDKRQDTSEYLLIVAGRRDSG